ncbi:c-type cytochrome [Vibrio sp. MA64]|uniref:c-type cytochrome n=1 Tax=Vibrio sp. MA64 TaxID=2896365 RepID=UPI001E288C3D|nr:cytochrome c [Vibrio sp. MA64]MCC9650237.1 cytochrome c [Vibrio sp. MA64]
MKSRLILVASVMAFPVIADIEPVHNPSYQLGAELAHSCAGCHGLTGISPVDSNPNLAGQNRDYLEYALKAYRSGERKGGMARIMIPNARGLSDDEIHALALYFSLQDSSLE